MSDTRLVHNGNKLGVIISIIRTVNMHQCIKVDVMKEVNERIANFKDDSGDAYV